jgi:type II secretory pathway pseudopilin PulG
MSTNGLHPDVQHAIHPGRCRSRRGYTILESVLLISVASVLLSVLGLIVARVSRSEYATRQHTYQIASMAQFADQLRDDVHLAVDLELASGAGDRRSEPLLRLADGTQVQYRTEGPRIIRQRTPANSTTEPLPTADAFYLAEDLRLSWEIHTAGTHRWVSVQARKRASHPVEPAGLSATQRGPLWRVEALLGRATMTDGPSSDSDEQNVNSTGANR